MEPAGGNSGIISIAIKRSINDGLGLSKHFLVERDELCAVFKRGLDHEGIHAAHPDASCKTGCIARGLESDVEEREPLGSKECFFDMA